MVYKCLFLICILLFPFNSSAQNNKPDNKPVQNSQKSIKNQNKSDQVNKSENSSRKQDSTQVNKSENLKNDNSSKKKQSVEQSDNPIEYPKLIKYISAKYPINAIKEKREGIVGLKIVIDKTGKVINVKVVKSIYPDLDQAAIDAVKQFVFSPAKLNGNPIKVKISLNYPFKLNFTNTKSKKLSKNKKKSTNKIKNKNEIFFKSNQIKSNKSKFEKIKSNKIKLKTKLHISSSLKGVLWEKGLNKNVAYAEVTLYKKTSNQKIKIASKWSNALGEFSFPMLPSGKYIIVANATGCKILRKTINYNSNKHNKINLYLIRYADEDNIIVTGLKKRKEVTKYTVTLDEIVNIPGTQGDALKAVQNMPGVARTPFGLGFLVIRGSAPKDSKIMFEGHEIPIIYHFLGITSVINSDLLKSIDFIPGNFSTKYGDAMGGIVDVKLKTNKHPSRTHGYIDSDLWDSGFYLTGPIKKGTFVLSARRSYIDGILRIPIIKEQVGFAPVYYDYQALITYPLMGGKFLFMLLGSDDVLTLLDYDISPYHTKFDKFLTFWKIYKHKSKLQLSFSGGKSKLDFFTPGQSTKITMDAYDFSWRPSFSHKFNKNFKIETGLPGKYTIFQAFLNLQFNLNPNDDSSTSLQPQQITYKDHIFYQAFYVESEWKLQDFTIIPGIRWNFFKTDISTLTSVDPRLSLSYTIIPKKLNWKTALGLYTQAPSPEQFNTDFYGNPNLKIQNSVHIATGADYKPIKSLTIKTSLFYKHLYDLTATTDATLIQNNEIISENIDNSGLGRILGAEFLLKKENSSSVCPKFLNMTKCFGWISYTLMKSERKDQINTDWYLFEFDQTHILTAVFSGLWKNNWRVGIRLRFTSGNPTTPVLGSIYDADSERYTPIYGKPNSDRLPSFHQLDVRIDKKFLFKHFNFNVYLDVQNIYNYQASEFIMYNFNYLQKSTVKGLPIFPSIGIKGQW